MRRKRAKSGIFLAAALLLTAGWLAAQAPDPKGAGQDPQKPKKSSAQHSEKKPPIAGAARVSTDSALEQAAKREAKKPAPTPNGTGPATEKAGEDLAGQEVIELRPADSEGATSSSVKVESQNSKKAKDLHGTVYGAADGKNPGARRAGGAVGASSKSGKTSVYVETERARTTPPR